jgi:hypothetical protein
LSGGQRGRARRVKESPHTTFVHPTPSEEVHMFALFKRQSKRSRRRVETKEFRSGVILVRVYLNKPSDPTTWRLSQHLVSRGDGTDREWNSFHPTDWCDVQRAWAQATAWIELQSVEPAKLLGIIRRTSNGA